MKKIFSVMLTAVLFCSIFAGCAQTDSMADEITKETLLIAYTEENAPFFEVSDDGKTFKGFEVDLIAAIFDSIKDECKNYAFVKVDKGYKLGEDTALTDADGNNLIAYMAVGGIQKNVGTNNEDYSFTDTIIQNKIIAVANEHGDIKNYSDFKNARVATVSEAADTVFKEHSAISGVCKSVKLYKDAESAFDALSAGKVDAVVIDEYNYSTISKQDKYRQLPSQLGILEYAIACAKYDRLQNDINAAIYELQSPEYNDKDEFTPLVGKYFGYDASEFDYKPISQ